MVLPASVYLLSCHTVHRRAICKPLLSCVLCRFLKNIAFSHPGLLGGNFSLPLLKPELALKLAQLGFVVPTPELGLKRATIGAALPVPDVQLAKRAVNLTLGVPDVSFKQVGVNLTVPDIQLPHLEFNVSGLPRVSIFG